MNWSRGKIGIAFDCFWSFIKLSLTFPLYMWLLLISYEGRMIMILIACELMKNLLRGLYFLSVGWSMDELSMKEQSVCLEQLGSFSAMNQETAIPSGRFGWWGNGTLSAVKESFHWGVSDLDDAMVQRGSDVCSESVSGLFLESDSFWVGAVLVETCFL